MGDEGKLRTQEVMSGIACMLLMAGAVVTNALNFGYSSAMYNREIKKLKSEHANVFDLSQIYRVDTIDINNDGLEDVVIENGSGDKTVFLNTSEGYLTNEQIVRNAEELVKRDYDAQVGEVKRVYETKLEGIRKAYGEPNSVGGEE